MITVNAVREAVGFIYFHEKVFKLKRTCIERGLRRAGSRFHADSGLVQV